MLKKLPIFERIPAQPYVPARPATTVCDPPPGSGGGGGGGEWVTICSEITLFFGYDYGPATFNNPGPFPKPIYGSGGITCRTEWRP